MNRHNLPLAWHAATDMSAIGCIQFKLSHKPGPEWLASIAEGNSIINATLLYNFTIIGKGVQQCIVEKAPVIVKINLMIAPIHPLECERHHDIRTIKY